MNKIAIIVILGLAAIASAQVDVETSEISDLIRPINRSNITGRPYPKPLPYTFIRPHPIFNKTNKTISPVRPNFNKTNKTIFPVRPHPIFNKNNKTNKTNNTNKTNKTNNTNKTNKTNKTFVIPTFNRSILPVRPHPIQNKTNKTNNTNKTFVIPTFNRSKIHSHFKNFTKVNASKNASITKLFNTSTSEALELFGKHLIKSQKNLTQVSQILQLVGQLFLVGSQCQQDLGGAFFVASIVAADAEAGFQDLEQDVIASVFVGLLAYQSATDCPPVVQVIEELINIL